MSYYTQLEITFAYDSPMFEAILDRVRSHLEARADVYPDPDFVVDQFREILESSDRGDIKGLESDNIDEILTDVSAGFPGVLFFARGLGEEFDDLWLRAYRDGVILVRIGPFADEVEAALDQTDP